MQIDDMQAFLSKPLDASLTAPLPKKARRQKALAERSRGIDSILTLFLGTSLPPKKVSATCGTHAFYTPSLVGLSALPA